MVKKNETICYEIDALQVMLPSALRAKYEKIITLQEENDALPDEAKAIFGKRQQANFKEFERAELLPLLKQLITNKIVKIENVVKQQGNVKEIRMVKISHNQQDIDRAMEGAARAAKQRQLIEWMGRHLGEVLLPQKIYEETGVSSAVLQSVIEKGAAHFIQEEVYRDPFTREVSRTQSLQLTDEQHIALEAITTSMEEQTAKTFFYYTVSQEVVKLKYIYKRYKRS